MLFVIVVDTPVVHERAHHATRSSTMFDMTHHHPSLEEGLIA
jgi:hypothetical protein